MKKCSTCKVPKSLSDFNFRNKSKGERHSQCKPCQKVCRDRHYKNNKPLYISRVGKRNTRIIAENKERVLAYLKAHPCACGESDPIVLEFDHNDGEDKKYDISTMTRFSWFTIEAEIAKCTVRCANCHRRRTAEQFGWK